MKDRMKKAQEDFKRQKALEGPAAAQYKKDLAESYQPPKSGTPMIPSIMVPKIKPELAKSKENLSKIHQGLRGAEQEMWKIAQIHYKKALDSIKFRLTEEEYVQALADLDASDFEEGEEGEEALSPPMKHPLAKD